MSFLFTIEKKRDRGKLSGAEIRAFVDGVVQRTIPDYQAAALCMAICLNGMDDEETRELIVAMLESGEQLRLGDDFPDAVEQHTTGCVGDGIDLVLLPLVAACGLRPTKLTGPSLGICTGIIDKVDAIPGFSTRLDRDEIVTVIRRAGLMLANHSADLVPVDARLYAIRDVTATIESVPLIAGSILSKKLATGSPCIHVSVKWGRGGFLRTQDEAERLARLMTEVATALGRRITVPVIRVDGVLGDAVGNALEIRQAIAIMRGGGPADIRGQIIAMGVQMLRLVGIEADAGKARAMLEQRLASGAALEKFTAWVAAQGGDPRVVDDPSLLPSAKVRKTVAAPHGGTVLALDPRAVARIVVELGGGRLKLDDALDHAAGIEFRRRNGDRVSAGETVATIHAADGDAADAAARALLAAYRIGEGEIVAPLVEGTVFGIGA